MENNKVSFSPHILDKSTSTKKMYIMMIMSIMPALIFGFIVFGIKAIIVGLVSILSVVVVEIVYNLVKLRKFAIKDYSCFFVGILFAVMLPPAVPFWCPIVAGVITEVLVKNCFGGAGKNIVSEASFAGVLTMLSCEATNCYLTAFKHVKTSNSLIVSVLNGEMNGISFPKTLFGLGTSGIGEGAIMFILLGGIFLCVIKTIDYKVPVIYLATVLIFSVMFVGASNAVYCVCGGGTMLCAFYMLTDFAVCPKTAVGKVCYAFSAGVITVLLWKYASVYYLGAYYAVLICGVVASSVSGLYRPQITGEDKK